MAVQTGITDPRGCSFLSYRRGRSKEATKLISAQRERGIPTWRDITDLDEEHTATELRRVLEQASTANAIMWITPDVKESTVIREIEAPGILERAEAPDSFFVVPVAGGNAGYGEASEAVGPDVSLTKLQEWNIHRVKNDPALAVDIREIAKRVLVRRIRAIHKSAPAEEAVSLGLHVRTSASSANSEWLSMDWTGRFNNRLASETVWTRHLLPAATDVVDTIEREAPGRMIVASGTPSLTAAFALGRICLAPRRLQVSWSQFTPGSGVADWSLSSEEEEVEFSARCRDSDPGADELAVLVSVNASVDQAFTATRESLPEFRGIVEVRYEREGRPPLSAGQALRLAHDIVREVRAAREKLRPKGAVHLFMAMPAGLAFLVGQLSNTLGPIRPYEHEESGAVGAYLPGPLLHL